MQIYKPMIGHEDEDVETVYEYRSMKLEELLGALKGSDHLVII